MKKNINLKGIIVVLIIGVFSICLVKQLTVLRRIKNDIAIQTQELQELKEKNIRKISKRKIRSDKRRRATSYSR